jgi:hypothetical protein
MTAPHPPPGTAVVGAGGGTDDPGTDDAGTDDAGTDDAGGVTLVLPMLLWVATLVAIVAIDIAGYLVAASRAQALADAAALAAVSADVPLDGVLLPVAEADRVVRAGDGQLEVCTCVPGAERAQVTVSVPVPGLVIPRLGATRVAADAAAVLAPPLPWDRGP